MKDKIYKEAGFIGFVLALIVFFGGKSYFYEFWDDFKSRFGSHKSDIPATKQETPIPKIVYIYQTNPTDSEDSISENEIKNDFTNNTPNSHINESNEKINVVKDAGATKIPTIDSPSWYHKRLQEIVAAQDTPRPHPLAYTMTRKELSKALFGDNAPISKMGGMGNVTFWAHSKYRIEYPHAEIYTLKRISKYTYTLSLPFSPGLNEYTVFHKNRKWYDTITVRTGESRTVELDN